jgi:hypothetical protein
VSSYRLDLGGIRDPMHMPDHMSIICGLSSTRKGMVIELISVKRCLCITPVIGLLGWRRASIVGCNRIEQMDVLLVKRTVDQSSS